VKYFIEAIYVIEIDDGIDHSKLNDRVIDKIVAEELHSTSACLMDDWWIAEVKK
jgi:hypothetical protein